MRARVLIAVAGAFLLAPVAPAAAQDGALVRVFRDYADDGRIDPCKHSSRELRAVQRSMPPDVEQYAPDFPSAVAGALEARARGDCLAGRDKSPATGVPAAPAPAAPVPSPPPSATPSAPAPTSTVVPDPPQPAVASVPAATATPSAADAALERAAAARPGNSAPLPVLLLAALAAVLAASAAVLLAARRMGWAEGPAHAWQEAAWRAEGVWQDFRDWLRLGR